MLKVLAHFVDQIFYNTDKLPNRLTIKRPVLNKSFDDVAGSKAFGKI